MPTYILPFLRFMFSLIFSPYQTTPLHRAADEGHVNTVQCLVEKGADISTKDGYGVSGILNS